MFKYYLNKKTGELVALNSDTNEIVEFESLPDDPKKAGGGGGHRRTEKKL